MDAIEKIIGEHKIGQAIFEQLFALNDDELKTKLISITDGSHADILTNNCDCTRTILNGKPEKVEFYYYGGLKIDWRGVLIVPEHGGEYIVVKFNDHFKL